MNDFDFLLRRALQNRAQDAPANPYLLQRIQTEYDQRKEHKKMKITAKRIIAIAAALCLLTASCCAAVQYAFIESHYTADITAYADLADAEKEVGFDAKYVEAFSNGFRFIRGGAGVNIDADGVETEFLSIIYQDDQGRPISLRIEPVLDVADGYSAQLYKVVPPDYRPTAEDAAMEASGEVVLSYGGDEVKTQTCESYYWQDGGLHYCLVGFDLNLGEAKLASMAEEIK